MIFLLFTSFEEKYFKIVPLWWICRFILQRGRSPREAEMPLQAVKLGTWSLRDTSQPAPIRILHHMFYDIRLCTDKPKGWWSTKAGSKHSAAAQDRPALGSSGMQICCTFTMLSTAMLSDTHSGFWWCLPSEDVGLKLFAKASSLVEICQLGRRGRRTAVASLSASNQGPEGGV